MLRYFAILTILTVSSFSRAHEGRTDDDGGHNCGPTSMEKKLCAGYHNHQPTDTSAPKYNRKDWPHWADYDNDCQNTRAEILIRDTEEEVEYSNNKGCSVLNGYWYDPYSDKIWTKASDLDIDHIVPLKWAHEHGAQYWTRNQRKQFSNDFENLIAVEDNLNRKKGAKSPDEWMPPNRGFRCDYIALFDDIVIKYNLYYLSSENRTINHMLMQCDSKS